MRSVNMYGVIKSFSQLETFTRYAVTVNAKGVENRTPLPTFQILCYIHPATDKDLKEIPREGYYTSNMIKIFSAIDADVIQDDEVTYQGKQYRVMKDNIKVVGNYIKYFAELLS